MSDAIQKYLEDHDVHFEICLIADDEIIESVSAYDLDEAIAQTRKLPEPSDYANEELCYSEADQADRDSKERA
ncbi:hypothetical protein [Polynucleobacter sp.]|uniref:hypothetical protein n=1 Tax=Polynucleobacter sp. TaxID=2029855 RepID=UPI003F69F74E